MALRTRFWMKKNEVEKEKYNLAFSGHSDSVWETFRQCMGDRGKSLKEKNIMRQCKSKSVPLKL